MTLMSEVPTRRVLVVANLTESTPWLLDEVERRAGGGCDFTLTVPPERHPDAPDWPPQEALELVRGAAKGRPVELVDCGADGAATIGDLVGQGTCDETLLSTPPEHHAHWHRHGLPERAPVDDSPRTRPAPGSVGAERSVERRAGSLGTRRLLGPARGGGRGDRRAHGPRAQASAGRRADRVAARCRRSAGRRAGAGREGDSPRHGCRGAVAARDASLGGLTASRTSLNT
jgi:hypothetical protein